MGWLIKSIKEKYKSTQMAKKKQHTWKLNLRQISNLIQLDDCFWKISCLQA